MAKGKRTKAESGAPDNLPPGVRLARTLDGHSIFVRGVVFDPQGRTLATGDSDGTVKLWDAVSGLLLRRISDHGLSGRRAQRTGSSLLFAPGRRDR